MVTLVIKCVNVKLCKLIFISSLCRDAYSNSTKCENKLNARLKYLICKRIIKLLKKSEDIQIPGDGHKASDGIYYYVSDSAKHNLTNKLRTHLDLNK
ncbi:hypothetical protein COK05_28705 [Bacillus cereus]|uniref:Uncharacterized protein n=1 Tax=Bacillus cereus TaxID=1396 RepID=A0A2B2L5S7_BACCE|nr:hypothetical protein COK05_28705 [Bacillus cereus]PGU07442.1 hypothetical protein COD21_23375 [Bacillus cereus]